jgi:hypothetical protein
VSPVHIAGAFATLIAPVPFAEAAVGLLRARQWRYLATERVAADAADATPALAREALLAEEDGSALPRWLVRIDERCQASAERLPAPLAT